MDAAVIEPVRPKLVPTLAVVLCLLLFPSFLGAQAGHLFDDLRPTVILISIDGFRNDYLEATSCSNIRKLAESGVRARWLIPVFPTKTFPNHYTIVTGLYVEHHGVVGNTMFDPEFDVLFTMKDREEVTNGRWWGGEPVWVTAEKQGQKSATFFWPGSEARIHGMRPSYWRRYDATVSYRERIGQVLNWLDYPAAVRPTLITVYFEGVDNAGHDYGPDFAAVDTAVRQVDAAIGQLWQGLQERGIDDRVNLVIVSDHGMAPVSIERTIYLDDYVDTSSVQVVDWGVVVSLWPKGDSESVYKKIAGTYSHVSVFKKSEVPERWHYRNHRRVAPIILVADDGWTITRRGTQSAWKNRKKGGNHGYDNQLPSMRAFFAAHGPAFQTRVVTEPFENVNLYNLMTAVLGLVPAANDGDPQVLKGVLRNTR